MTRAIEDGDCTPLIDPKLGDKYNYVEVARMVACAAACVRHSAKRRPRMGMVLFLHIHFFFFYFDRKSTSVFSPPFFD